MVVEMAGRWAAYLVVRRAARMGVKMAGCSAARRAGRWERTMVDHSVAQRAE
jgi:hypothetical protein